MRRRELIILLGGAAVARPRTAVAQPTKMPVIGFLNGFSMAEWAQPVTGFRSGLTETGYVEGKYVAIEYRWAEGHFDRLPGLAAELVRRQVTVLVATVAASRRSRPRRPPRRSRSYSVSASIRSRKDSFPVSQAGRQPDRGVLPDRRARGKRRGLLRELVPTVALIGALLNPKIASFEARLKNVESVARAFGQQIQIHRASSEAELDSAFATFGQLRAGALLVGADPFFLTQRERIVALAARHGIPAVYEQREFAEAGGLMSYGRASSSSGCSRTPIRRRALVFRGLEDQIPGIPTKPGKALMRSIQLRTPA